MTNRDALETLVQNIPNDTFKAYSKLKRLVEKEDGADIKYKDQKWICPTCGTEVELGDNYCRFCGLALIHHTED